MNWLRNIIKETIFSVAQDAYLAKTRIKALEDHLNIEYFHGDKQKAHYRKRKTPPKRPIGRPSKKK